MIDKLRDWSQKNPDIASLPFILLAVILLMTLATSGKFLSKGNLNAFASQIPELGLLSLATMVVMITNGINLSIISSANLVGVTMALMMTNWASDGMGSGMIVLIVLVTLAVGLLLSVFLGWINGALIAYVGLPPMLATLGTMLLYEGVTLTITKGFVISGMPDIFVEYNYARLFGVPLPLLTMILALAAVAVILIRRPFGRTLYMIGSSETVTQFSAIDTRKAIVKAYILSGILCGIAGMIMLARFNSANARSGSSLLLLTILISVLGGTDPNGGFGRVIGLTLALFILQLLTSGLNLLGVTQFITLALWGVLLIAVIAYRRYSESRRH